MYLRTLYGYEYSAGKDVRLSAGALESGGDGYSYVLEPSDSILPGGECRSGLYQRLNACLAIWY